MKLYCIADLVVGMDCQGRTYRQAQPYLCNNEEEMQICINQQKEKAYFQSMIHPEMNEDEWEYMLTGSFFYRNLPIYQGMLLHASAVVYENKAYLFSAPCGTGKSTHTSLWLKQFPSAYILNDDKPAIRCIGGKFYAYGTPWSGKSDSNVPARVPLQGICFLHQDQENWIEELANGHAIRKFLPQTTRKLPLRRMEMLMKLLEQVINDVKIFEMGCRIDQGAVQTSYYAMRGDE